MFRYFGMVLTVSIFTIAVICLPPYLNKGILPSVRLIIGIFLFIGALLAVAEFGMRLKAKRELKVSSKINNDFKE